MYLCNKILGVDENKVIFTSFNGKAYSDNPRAISEKLHEVNPRYKIVWLFNNPYEKRNVIPNYVKPVKAKTFQALKELATSMVWIDNFCKPSYVYKNKNQIYIQTWHGDRGFKKILYDVRTKMNNGYYKEGDLVEPKYCNLVISGSDFADNVYRSAFGYKGDILKFGTPRNDILVQNNEKKIKEIKLRLQIESDRKILLYAPTFRKEAGNKLQDKGSIDLHSILSILEDRTGYSWICFVRAHSAVKGLSGISTTTKIYDLSDYEEMNELLIISDFLITDYSSCAGDFALLNRPIVLFHENREDFQKRERTFYFDLDRSPYMIASNQDELENLINKLEWGEVPGNCESILEFYGTFETGESSKKIVEYILSK